MERDEIKRKVTRVNPHHHQSNLQEQRGQDLRHSDLDPTQQDQGEGGVRGHAGGGELLGQVQLVGRCEVQHPQDMRLSVTLIFIYLRK